MHARIHSTRAHRSVHRLFFSCAERAWRKNPHGSSMNAASAKGTPRHGVSGGRVGRSVRSTTTSRVIQTGLSILDTALGIRTGELVEVCGASHAGKTQLLYWLVAAAIAPPPIGRGVEVCWFELNDRFDTNRMQHLLELRGVQDARACLNKVYLYTPHTTMALVATLHSLMDLLQTHMGRNRKYDDRPCHLSCKERTLQNVEDVRGTDGGHNPFVGKVYVQWT